MICQIRSIHFRPTIIALIAIALLAACSSGAHRRSFGTVIDDQAAEIRALDTIYALPEFDHREPVHAAPSHRVECSVDHS